MARQDPAPQPAAARRICDVHGEQVTAARPAAQTYARAFFFTGACCDRLLSSRAFLTAVGVAATRAGEIPLPMRHLAPPTSETLGGDGPVAVSKRATDCGPMQRRSTCCSKGADTPRRGDRMGVTDPRSRTRNERLGGLRGRPKDEGVVQLGTPRE